MCDDFNLGGYTPAISFAWEDGLGLVKIKDEILSALENTERIIVIGYSFPYFNREIDSYIMQCFKKYAKGKIYLQAPAEHADSLMETLKELKEDWRDTAYVPSNQVRSETKFYTKTNTDQFFMSF